MTANVSGPQDEAQRVQALHRAGILDTGPDERFDRATSLARSLFNVPIALVSLVDETRQWFKSHPGLDLDETPRSMSFCSHAIAAGDDVFVVEDAGRDPRFADNPLVVGDPRIRFYAGQPLSDPDGYRLGTLCIIDRQPRALRPDEAEALKELAYLVEAQINATAQERRFRALVEQSVDMILVATLEGTVLYESPSVAKVFGPIDQRPGGAPFENVHPEDHAELTRRMQQLTTQPGTPVQIQVRVRDGGGGWRWFDGVGTNMLGDPAIRGVVVNLRDITARKDSEAVLQELNRQRDQLRRFLSPQVADLVLTSGSEALLGAHRSRIAAVFCDLRGFTNFAQGAEPEDLMGVLREYHEAMGAEITKQAGTLGFFEADGILVFFNDPIPCEDPEMRAVRMALGMQESMVELGERWRRQGYDLGLGIGIDVGFATLGTIGYVGRSDYTAIGTTVNQAARLCAEATAGQILMTERSYAAVDGLIEATYVKAFSLKGIARPVQAYEAHGLKMGGPGKRTNAPSDQRSH